ncbi:MAG TPA: magnesium transporter, partial [Alphaproteobacteria bacterium]|nr:magnesium transporter [Alphaproteobacteria bacterium]
WGWFGDWLIGLVFGVAMFSTLLIAAVVGSLVPIFLERWKIDPADSSVVLVTTVTDMVAFASFLGLAYLVL